MRCTYLAHTSFLAGLSLCFAACDPSSETRDTDGTSIGSATGTTSTEITSTEKTGTQTTNSDTTDTEHVSWPDTTQTTSSVDTTSNTVDSTSTGDNTSGTSTLTDSQSTTDSNSTSETESDSAGEYQLDLLFVVDNSSGMDTKFAAIGDNLKKIAQELASLQTESGDAVGVSLHLAVTSTDMGHPGCRPPAGAEDYVPAKGEAVGSACLDRESAFHAGDRDVFSICTDLCPTARVPNNGQFIAWNSNGENNIGDATPQALAQALACIAPQGIAGCGYESPLEAMYQALDPQRMHNQAGFLRKSADLAIVLISDEPDCSVVSEPANQTGYPYFDEVADAKDYMELHPVRQKKTASSAVCWNGGVNCVDANQDGIYESCSPADRGVLFPTARYHGRLQELRTNAQAQGYDKQIFMLGLLGVPHVSAHNPLPPFEPIAGGALGLTYRHWETTDITQKMIQTLQQENGLDSPPTLELAQSLMTWSFGIGPSCRTSNDGYAIAPVRMQQVCSSLNDSGGQAPHCCVESICDDDLSNAAKCLQGMISKSLSTR